MKKILFPALAVVATLATSTAFAQGDNWYVLRDTSTADCFAAHRVNDGAKEDMIGGPYQSQIAALSAANQDCSNSASSRQGINYTR